MRDNIQDAIDALERKKSKTKDRNDANSIQRRIDELKDLPRR
jgi:hypothetical protein